MTEQPQATFELQAAIVAAAVASGRPSLASLTRAELRAIGVALGTVRDGLDPPN